MSKKNLLRIAGLTTWIAMGVSACYFMSQWDAYPLSFRVIGATALIVAGVCLKSMGTSIRAMP